MATVLATQGHSLEEAAFSSEAREAVAVSRIEEAEATEAEIAEVSPGVAVIQAAAAPAEIGSRKAPRSRLQLRLIC